MTRAKVAGLMARQVKVGVEIDPVSGEVRPIEIKSLYSTEMLQLGKEVYLVDRYMDGEIQPDKVRGNIADDLLMPMVFYNDLLVAKGREGLEALKSVSRR
jgi:hypothetical protein